MFKKKTKLYIYKDEKRIIMNALVDLRNEMLKQGKSADIVNEVIIKLNK